MLDVSDAKEEMRGGVIPDGEFVKLQLNWKAGGETIPGMDPIDNGLFVQSKSSDAKGIQAELTVLEPPQYAHRKIFEWWTVTGGALDEKGASKGWNITKARLRAILESATGTDPKDESAQAKANRQVQGFMTLENCPFYAKLTVEQDEGYAAKNRVDYVVTPADPEYALLKAKQRPEPKPRNAPGKPKAAQGTAPAAAQKPAWEQPKTATAAQPAGPAQQTTQAAASPPAAPATARPAWAT